MLSYLSTSCNNKGHKKLILSLPLYAGSFSSRDIMICRGSLLSSLHEVFDRRGLVCNPKEMPYYCSLRIFSKEKKKKQRRGKAYIV